MITILHTITITIRRLAMWLAIYCNFWETLSCEIEQKYSLFHHGSRLRSTILRGWATKAYIYIYMYCSNIYFLFITFPFFSQFRESSTRRRIKLKEVMDIDHGKNYLNDDRAARKCNQCEYTSSHASNLRTHFKTHSGEKPNKCKSFFIF